MLGTFIRKIRAYCVETRGSIAVLAGLSLPVVIGATGMALDLAQAYLVRERLTHALDAAALAGSAIAGQGGDLEQKVRDFLDANYPPEKIGSTYDIVIQIDGDDILVSAKANYDTTFLYVIGIESIDVAAETIVRREVRGIEVALVLDVTGSMAGNNNIQALRDGSELFINTLFNRVTNAEHLKIGLVPYAATINLGSIAPEIVQTPIVPARPDVGYDTADSYQWQGCLEERNHPDDMMDTDIYEGGKWPAFWWEHTADGIDNKWDPAQGGSLNLAYTQCNNRRTPNLGCPVTNPVVPLSSDKDLLLQSSRDLVYWCRGGTMGNIGMAWGWRALSPQEPLTGGAAYDDKYWRKIIVMMTDGDNTFWRKPNIVATSDYTAYGRVSEARLGTTNRGTATTRLNERFEETCEMIKDHGITIYTITFTSGVNATTKGYYKRCASDETKYIDAPSKEELIEAFEKIGKEISNLHIRG